MFFPLNRSSCETKNQTTGAETNLGGFTSGTPQTNPFFWAAGGHRSLWNGTSDSRTPDFGGRGTSAHGRKWISSHSQQPPTWKGPRNVILKGWSKSWGPEDIWLFVTLLLLLNTPGKFRISATNGKGLWTQQESFIPLKKMWVRIKSPNLVTFRHE